MKIFYRAGDNLFVNITNACPCDCVFCIRRFSEGYGDADTLWLDREPSIDEIKAAFARQDLSKIDEIVFCGFGEPMERANDVITLANFFKQSGKKIRLNTNGLVRLMHPTFDIALLSVFDVVSISLNADDADEYMRVTRPKFGAAAYDEMLNFAADMRQYTTVALSIVGVIDAPRIENCREIAHDLGVTFRVR